MSEFNFTPISARESANESSVAKDLAGQSIKAIIRANPRESLLVKPTLWTERHLDLLGCRFEDEEDEPELEADFRDDPTLGNLGVRVLALSQIRKTKRKEFSTILTSGQSPYVMASLQRLNFRYDGRDISKMTLPFYKRQWPSSTGGGTTWLTTLAYVDYLDLRDRRCNSVRVRPGPGGAGNPPVERLRQRRIERYSKTSGFYDPFVLALLVTMAQRQKTELKALDGNHDEEDSSEAKYTVQAATTWQQDPESIHVFQAEVPGNLLRKFERPDFAAAAGVAIKHTKVRYSPLDTFASRLIAKL